MEQAVRRTAATSASGGISTENARVDTSHEFRGFCCITLGIGGGRMNVQSFDLELRLMCFTGWTVANYVNKENFVLHKWDRYNFFVGEINSEVYDAKTQSLFQPSRLDCEDIFRCAHLWTLTFSLRRRAERGLNFRSTQLPVKRRDFVSFKSFVTTHIFFDSPDPTEVYKLLWETTGGVQRARKTNLDCSLQLYRGQTPGIIGFQARRRS